jgi:tetratricopeptide (TPR) repeat protein
MFGVLEPTLPASELREQVRIFRARIYRDWARFHLAKGNRKTTAKLLSQGEALLKEEQWQVRYELLAVRGELLMKQKAYSSLLIRYEKFLPSIQDPALKAQVNQFVGQIYLTWAQSAKKAGNLKSTRIRSWRALEYLPESEWQRRLAAATLLNGTLDKLKRFAEAAEVFEALIPTIPDKEVRRRYALFLGRKYLKQIKQPDAAEPWLNEGDLGGNDPLSLEAGYLTAEMRLEKKERNEAKGMLEELTGRDLSQSNWRVPIHSQLALIYHEDKELEKALENYRVVAATKSKVLRRLYPRSIDIAKEQVHAIRGYLRFKGGSGPKVAVPKVAR